ncbi:MAG: peptidoglycan editing factor PgeF [Alphaproteobacteria bacterium]|nr:peptidoglycan editing factor PgeF [Alphaproteobacteria bacterium]
MTWIAPNLTIGKHCFCGSAGGVSQGIYKGLNVNTRSDDVPENLVVNLDIAAARVGLKKENLLLLRQGVSATAVFVEKASQDMIEADGAVTNRPDIGLCIRTADCAPVLLEDRQNGIVGVAHAGWRGAFKGIIENVVALMIEKGAVVENIKAAVGPCIGQKSYEVDEAFYKQFTEKDQNFTKYFVSGKDSHFYQFDLEEFCVDVLKKCGILDISVSGLDTYALAEDYYSLRRITHQGIVQKPKCFATELSVIVL